MSESNQNENKATSGASLTQVPQESTSSFASVKEVNNFLDEYNFSCCWTHVLNRTYNTLAIACYTHAFNGDLLERLTEAFKKHGYEYSTFWVKWEEIQVTYVFFDRENCTKNIAEKAVREIIHQGRTNRFGYTVASVNDHGGVDVYYTDEMDTCRRYGNDDAAKASERVIFQEYLGEESRRFYRDPAHQRCVYVPVLPGEEPWWGTFGQWKEGQIRKIRHALQNYIAEHVEAENVST